MAKREPTISPSQLDSMACRFAWYLGYKKGYRPVRSSSALELGKGIHEALDFYYSGQGDPVPFFAAWADRRYKEINPQWDDDQKDLEEIRDLGLAMLKGYLEQWEGQDNFTVLATEKTLKRKLPVPGTGTLSKCNLVIRLDGLVRCRETGNLFSLEHKTFSRIDYGHFERDHQMTAQVWCGENLAKEMGLDEPVVGVIYNGLRKQKPGPKVKLKLFERHKLYRTARHIEVFLHRAYWQYREMNREDVPIYPQPNPIRCGQCDFKDPCTEYMRGGDWKFLLEELYTCRS